MIIYQVYPRSFYDSNGDGIGDLPGIVDKMGYIADLGADAVWVSPFFTSPMKDFGYDISDYRGVDPLFGTLQDADALIAAAHRYGLKILIDQVWGHCSDQHPWFKESRTSRHNDKADWFVWADPKADGYYPNNWLSIFGGPAWSWSGTRRQYYLHHFLKEQPAVNLRHPPAFDAMMAESLFWLERGVDGFRVDAVPYFVVDENLTSNPPLRGFDEADLLMAETNPRKYQDNCYNECVPELLPLLEKIRATFQAKGFDPFMVGEITKGGIRYLAQATHGGQRFQSGYNGMLSKGPLTKAGFDSVLTDVLAYFDDPHKKCWSLGNHDVVRLWTRITETVGPDHARACWQMIITLYFSLPGHLCWYQGDELGLSEADIPYEAIQDPYGKIFWPEFKGRDGCRTPMLWDDTPGHGFTAGAAWLPIPPQHQGHDVACLGQQPDSFLGHVKTAIAQRKNIPALLEGGCEKIILAASDVLVFKRTHARGDYVCAFNFAAYPQEVVLPNTGQKIALGAYGHAIAAYES